MFNPNTLFYLNTVHCAVTEDEAEGETCSATTQQHTHTRAHTHSHVYKIAPSTLMFI